MTSVRARPVVASRGGRNPETLRKATTVNLKRFPRYPLTFGRTPIQPLKRLSAYLGGQVDLYAKREDCNSGLAFGGNKTRKLEYLIPEALAEGCDTLVSIGGYQSNQTRQVAAVAAHLGMKCVLVQENWVEYNDAVYDRVGNIQMSRILGADVRLDAAGFDIGIRPSWKQALEDVRNAGGKPYPIPAGCSEHPLGGLGYVGFAEEVVAQETELGFKFDFIVVCSVTGSTQAGMIVGFAAYGRAVRIIGIDASAKPAQTKAQVTRIARHTAELVALGREIVEQDVVLDTRYGGPAYGLPNEGTLDAIRLCARQEGVLTDPVYEGKSMHGMIDMVRQGEFPRGSKVLYAHLGGVPALNAYSFLFRNG
jgi:1-aminocyclopropane-1-carboxylate deaminase